MKKKSIILIIALVVLVALYFVVSASLKNNDENLDNGQELSEEDVLVDGNVDGEFEPAPIFCAMDVRECPDGSFVGRIAPDCEFAACLGDEALIEEAGAINPELIGEPIFVEETPIFIEEETPAPEKAPELIELTVE